MNTNKKYSQEEFEQLAKGMHGDSYNYKKDSYQGMDIPYKVECLKHGVFSIKPRDLIHQRHGCRTCYEDKLTTNSRKSLEDKVNDKWSGRYKVSSWLYGQGLIGEVNCTCENHGEYRTTCHKILNNKYGGCPKCKSYQTGLTFIEKSKKVHGEGKYLYDPDAYVCSRTPMRIFCLNHNIAFDQRPSAHLQGQGCPQCGEESRKETKANDTEYFIEKAKKVHGDKYDYSLVRYETSHVHIDIICKDHGVFTMTPNNHWAGYGCSNCASEERRKNFEIMFKDKVGDSGKYSHLDFSKAVYINNSTPLDVYCKIHDTWFTSTANKLLDSRSNVGCRHCYKVSLGRWTISSTRKIPNIDFLDGYFYIGNVSGIEGVKLGITKDLQSRLSCYKRDMEGKGIEFTYKNTLALKVLEATILEVTLKKLFKNFNVKHEYDFGGKGEFYDVEHSPIWEDIFSGVYNDKLKELAKTVTSNNHKDLLSFVAYLKDKYKV